MSIIEDNNQVLSRVWTLEGENIEVEPEDTEIEYVFSQPGSYEVTLTLVDQ